MKTTEPAKDFVGQDLDVVQKHEKFMKYTLKTMGIQDDNDQDLVVEKIKILVNEEETAKDVWGKQETEKSDDDKSKSSETDWS